MIALLSRLFTRRRDDDAEPIGLMASKSIVIVRPGEPTPNLPEITPEQMALLDAFRCGECGTSLPAPYEAIPCNDCGSAFHLHGTYALRLPASRHLCGAG